MIVLVLVLVIALAPCAFAQQPPPPVGPYVIDVRGSIPYYPQSELLAAQVGRPATTLPTRGLGVTLGGHWYPVSWRAVTLGIGGEVLLSRGRRGPSEEELVAAGTDLPTITTRLSGYSPQVSLNFGTGNGWSYLSGGIGRMTLVSRRDDVSTSTGDVAARMTNYGGGARWFTSDHVAFTLDLRFYRLNGAVDATGIPVAPRASIIVLNAGIAFR